MRKTSSPFVGCLLAALMSCTVPSSGHELEGGAAPVDEPRGLTATAEQPLDSAPPEEPRTITATPEQVRTDEEAATPIVRAPLAVGTIQPAPGPRPEDVESPRAIVLAAYDTISGAAGEARDWERLRSLFHPALGRMVPVQRLSDGSRVPVPMSPQQYIERAGPYFEQESFYERQLQSHTISFGALAQVASSYASSREPGDDAEPFARGANFFDLFDDGERWWILSISWQEEEPGLSLPIDWGAER